MLDLLLYSHKFLRLCSFIFILFSPRCSYWIIYFVLFFPFTNFSLLCPPVSCLSHSWRFSKLIIIITVLIIFFSLKISVWDFVIYSVYLMILFNFSCFIYVHNCLLKHFLFCFVFICLCPNY